MYDQRPYRTDSRSQRLSECVHYALLAPSAFNSQPWLFRVLEDAIEVRADRSRALAVIDPFDRELSIACGAALFNLRVALLRYGWSVGVDVMPVPSDPDLLARVVLLGHDGEPEDDTRELFDTIPRRGTHRGSFEDRRIPPEVLSDLQRRARAHGAWLHVLDGPKRDAAADLIARADLLQSQDPHFRREQAVWTSRGGVDAATRSRALLAPTLVLLTTRHEETAAWIDAGQALEHVLLRAAACDVQASFHNQPLEVARLRPSLARLTGHGGFAQVLLGLGHAPATHPGPRRGLDEVLID